jgi:hypothetical protein
MLRRDRFFSELRSALKERDMRNTVGAVSAVLLTAAMALTACTARRIVYWPAGAIFSERGDWVYFVIRKTDVSERHVVPAHAQITKGELPLCPGYLFPVKSTV